MSIHAFVGETFTDLYEAENAERDDLTQCDKAGNLPHNRRHESAASEVIGASR